MPIVYTIVDIMRIVRMIIVVGESNGNGDSGRGNNGDSDDDCHQHCSNADGSLVCGQQRTKWQQLFCSNCHAVKLEAL